MFALVPLINDGVFVVPSRGKNLWIITSALIYKM